MSGTGRKERRFSAAAAQAFAGLRGHLIYVAVFSAVANILLLAPSLYSLQVYDRVVSSRSALTLVFVSLALVVALGAFSVLDQLRMRLLARAGLKLDRELAPLALRMTLMAPSNDPVRRQGLRDLDRVRGALSGAPVLALIDLPWSVLFILCCFLLQWAIGLLALFGSIALVGLAVLNERAMSAAQERSSDTLARTYAAAEAVAQQSETVTAMGMGGAVARRIIDSRLEALATQLHISFTAGAYQAVIRGFRMVLQSAALGVGAFMVIEGKMSAGAIFAASLLTARALGPTEAIVGAWKPLQSAYAAWRRLNELTAAPGAHDTLTALPPPVGRIRLDNIVVRTGIDTFALRNVSLEVSPGEMIGVIGPSGAGKSTLARVIVGALKPDGGRVSYDGADHSQWSQDRLGGFIGWQPQEVSLLGGTIAENIARFDARTSANAEAIDAAVVRAATLAGAHEMILRLPRGYQTPVSIVGRGLSGGQAQRVALARAVYRDPPICVFDEPDAHVDSDAERALMSLLQALKARGATVILVGHRAGLMRFVDRLVVLDAGVITSVKTAEPAAAALGTAPA